jgi:hypothetical protein
VSRLEEREEVMGPPTIAAYANCDDACVIWRHDERIPACRSFALYRRPEGEQAEPVHVFVPFAGQDHEPGSHQPSTVWPIQKFAWTDASPALARSCNTKSCRW